MKYRKIVLAGGNGYLGTVLAAHFKDVADEVVILSRKPRIAHGNISTVVWDAKQEGDWCAALQGADLLVNLCGKNVNCRYNEKNRKEIIASRVVPTTLLGIVVAKLDDRPKVWINVTSATIYRHAEDRSQDEVTGEIGDGFSIEVCKAWEQAFFASVTPHTRKIALRMGIVLGNSDGVFPRLLNMVKLGLGGQQGNGRQYVAWIHEQDVAGITEWLLDNPKIDGIVNGTAPAPVKNKELMHTICKASHIPFGLPAPKWLLEIGAIVIGTETELILKSRWVVPSRLLNEGYVFKYPEIGEAVEECVGP